MGAITVRTRRDEEWVEIQIADSGNYLIRKITSTGMVSNVNAVLIMASLSLLDL